MTAGLNRVFLVGNLTRDPELRYVSSGVAVTDLGLAVNERRKNAEGEWTEETTFLDVTLWRRQAEIANQYLSKGSPVLIEGRLKLDSWETPEGEKRYKLRVVSDRMQMLGKPGGGGGSPPSRNESEYSQPAESFESSGVASGTQPQQGDDIPF